MTPASNINSKFSGQIATPTMERNIQNVNQVAANILGGGQENCLPMQI